jgi:hypothetical protein
VEDGFVELDVSEVALALSALAAGLALLVEGGNAKSEVVGAYVGWEIPPRTGFMPS